MVIGSGATLRKLLLSGVACVAAHSPAQAQVTGVGGAPVVTITASRLGAEVFDVPLTVSVVPEETLEAQLAISTDILEVLGLTVPGMSASRGSRIGCDSNIRGRTASFQINGIPVNQDLRASSCNAMFQVSPFAIERVEVVRGATALYGAGAPGGIVNLITRRASSEELEVDGVARYSFNPDNSSKTGQYDLYAGAGQVVGAWDWYFGAAYQDVGAARAPEGQFVPREGYHSWGLNGSIGLDGEAAGRLRLTGTFYHEERGPEYAADLGAVGPDGFAPVFRIADNPFKDEGYDQLYSLLLSYDVDDVLGHRLSMSGYLQQQTFLQRANFFDSSFGGDFFFDSDTENGHAGFRSTLGRNFMLGEHDLALNYGFDFLSNRFYRPIIEAATDNITGFVSPEITLRTYGFFAQADLEIGRLNFIGGARRELYRGEVGDKGFSPSISGAATPGDIGESALWLFNLGATFDLTPGLQIYGGYSQGAELTELGRAARGIDNPALISPEPATSDQYELGIRGAIGPVSYTAVAFYSESDRASLLQADPNCAGEPFCPLIPLRTPQRFHGAEATLDWIISDRTSTGAILTYQRGEIFDENLARYVEYSTDVVSPLRITGYIEFEPIMGWRNRFQATYFGAADYFTPAETALGFLNTDSVFLAEFSSSYKIGPGDLVLSISNLFNNEYVNAANQAGGPGSFFYYREEGRRLSLMYRVRL